MALVLALAPAEAIAVAVNGGSVHSVTHIQMTLGLVLEMLALWGGLLAFKRSWRRRRASSS